MSAIKHSHSTKSNTQDEMRNEREETPMSVIDELKNLNSAAPAVASSTESEFAAPVTEAAQVAETVQAAVASAKAKNADADLSLVRERAVAALEAAQAEKRTNVSLPEGALSPEIQALINSQTQATIKAILDQFVPVFQKMTAPSPKEAREQEQIDALKKRFERERDEMMAQDAEARENKRKLQANCTHRDANEKSKICLIRNLHMSGGAPVGICPECHLMIRPLRFEELPPACHTKADGEAFLRDLVAQGTGFTRASDFIRERGAAALEALVIQSGIKLAAPNARGFYRTLIVPADPLYGRVMDLVRLGK